MNGKKREKEVEEEQEQEKNEILFWEVIHNKYLFHKVLYFIENDHESFDYDFEFTKFKYIKSLNWMIEKDAYELLICKLKAKESIEFSKSGLRRLMACFTDYHVKEIEKEQFQEILSLMLLNYSLDLVAYDLMFLAIIEENCDAIIILSNQPFSIPIYPYMLGYSIINLSYPTVSTILKSPTLIIDNKIGTLQAAVLNNKKNYGIKEEEEEKDLVELILNNPQIHSKSYTDSKITIDTMFNKTIRSDRILNQLIDIGCFSPLIQKETLDSLYEEEKERFEKLFPLVKYILLSDDHKGKKAKEIHKVFAQISQRLYYRSYLSRYSEIIDGLYIDYDLDYCFTDFNVQVLKQLISTPFRELKGNYTSYQPRNKKEPYIEFIKIYTSQQIYRNDLYDNRIKDFIFSKLSNQTLYEQIIQVIPSDNKLKLPLKWDSVLNCIINNLRIVINNTDSIDWIAENITKCELLKDKLKDFKSGKSIQFETYELVEYSAKKFDSIPLLLFSIFNSEFYKYPYLQAINNCDIGTMKYIDNRVRFVDVDFNVHFKPETTIGDINKLVKYLNSLDYRCLSNKSIETFNSLIKGLLLKDIGGGDVHSKVIDFSMTKFVDSILNFNPDFNYFDPILNETELFIKEWEFVINGSADEYDVLYSYDEEYIISTGYFWINYDKITECIETIINQYNKNKSSPNAGDNYFKIIETILNHYFRNYLNSCFSDVKLVKHIYQLIYNSGFKVEHTVFHSWFYLIYKSDKFEKYLLQLPDLVAIIQFYGDEAYHCNKNYGNEEIYYDICYNISYYLNPSIFTYELIFGENSSFDDILDKLIVHLSHNPSFNNESIKNKYLEDQLNSNLVFLLEIKRVDLFFKELDYIKQLLSLKQVNYVFTKISQTIQNCSDNCKISLMEYKFNYSYFLFHSACNNLDTDGFKRFIEFCSYQSVFNILTETEYPLDNTTIRLLLYKHFDVFNHTITNHINVNKKIKYKENNISIWENLVSNHNFVNFIIEYHQKTGSSVEIISIDNLVSSFNSDNLGYYNIKLRELVLKIYGQTKFDQHLKITKSKISEAIKGGHILFLKYYYENGEINNENELLQHLQNEISKDDVYNQIKYFK